MVRYVLMKAKHHCASKQHKRLSEELKVVKAELKKEKDEKEALLDQFFQVMFKWVIILISLSPASLPWNSDLFIYFHERDDTDFLISIPERELLGDNTKVAHGVWKRRWQMWDKLLDIIGAWTR